MKKENLMEELACINEKSSLQEIQKYVANMCETRGFHNTPLELLCYLTEEIGELAREIRKKEHMEMDTEKTYDSSLKNEIADVFIYLLSLSNAYDIDLLESFKAKEAINMNRIWK